jgi:hypothetical protein
MSTAVPKLLALALAFLLAAGCTDAPQIETDLTDGATDGLNVGGRDLRTDLLASDEVPAPEWKVGDWFGHHVFAEGLPSGGVHFDTMVVEDRGNMWIMATDNKAVAKFEAVWDIPMLGEIRKSDLSTTAFGQEWRLYEFPLKNNHTWARTILDFNSGRELPTTFTATYNPAIATPDGPRPGFDIVGVTDGKVLFRYDYVPAVGWYAHFYYYDVDSTTGAFLFHVMNMGRGSDWTGTYYLSAAKALVQQHGGMAVDPGNPTNYFLEPKPYSPFTVAAEATYVYGFLGAFAWTGAYEVLLLDPNNAKHEIQVVGPPPEGAGKFQEFDVPAVAGEWKLFAIGAGVAAIHFVFLFEVTETAHTL